MDETRTLTGLPLEDQREIQEIFAGTLLPPLYSDVIAKRILSADVHPERLNFLMRAIAQDPTIDVGSSAANELFRQSVHSKGMVLDIPAWLKDRRFTNLEIQKVRQEHILTRAELYASDMLLLQYSTHSGERKSDVTASNLKEVLLIVLMVESPLSFREFDKTSERYIHRFTHNIADSGFSDPSKANVILVQLDKCLAQFKVGRNAEAVDGKPDNLQTWLAMIADPNDAQVSAAAILNSDLLQIRREARNMVQDKEVQHMLIQERYERMDWLSYGEQNKAEGIAVGRTEGIAEGIVLRDRQKIEAMLRKGRTPSEIRDFGEYPMDLIAEVQNEILKAK